MSTFLSLFSRGGGQVKPEHTAENQDEVSDSSKGEKRQMKSSKSVSFTKNSVALYNPEQENLPDSSNDQSPQEENSKVSDCDSNEDSVKHEAHTEEEECHLEHDCIDLDGPIEDFDDESLREVSQRIRECKEEMEGKARKRRKMGDDSKSLENKKIKDETIRFVDEKLQEQKNKEDREVFHKLLEMKADLHSSLGDFIEALRTHQIRVDEGAELNYAETSWSNFLKMSQKAKGTSQKHKKK